MYIGTSDFAATVLDRLVASAHRPQLVVTRPDARRGRGRRVAPPPVAETARRRGIQLLQPEDVNSADVQARIAEAAPAAIAVCAYGALIDEPLLSAHELLNVHPSLLPRWRGAAPIERAIEAGDEVTGISVMRLVAELDAGPVALQRAEEIRSGDTYGSLAARLAALGGELLVEALDLRPSFRAQPDSGVTYADKIGPEDRRLDPSRSADLLERRVRALTPHVGAYVELPGGERLGVRRAALAAGEGPPPGELAAVGGRLLLGTASGALQLCEVHPAGKRPMDAEAWIRGHGARLAS